MYMSFKKIVSKLLLLQLSILLLCTCSCAQHKIKIRNTAYSDIETIPTGFAKNSSFTLYVTSRIDGSDENNSLQARELEQKMALLLKDKGYAIATTRDQSDYCLVFNYGVETHTEKITVPRTTQKSTGYGFYGNYRSESIAYVPEQQTIYTTFVSCNVYDTQDYIAASREKSKKNGRAPQAIWHSKAVTINKDSNIREYLDALVISLYDLFGKSLRGTKEVKTSTHSARVASLHKRYVASVSRHTKKKQK